MPSFIKKNDENKENLIPGVVRKNPQFSNSEREFGRALNSQRPVFYPRGSQPYPKRIKQETPTKCLQWKENSHDIDRPLVDCSVSARLDTTSTGFDTSPPNSIKRAQHRKIRFQESQLSNKPEFEASRSELVTVIESRMLEPQLHDMKTGERPDSQTNWTQWNDKCWISGDSVLLNPRSIQLEHSAAYKYSPHTYVVQPIPSPDT